MEHVDEYTEEFADDFEQDPLGEDVFADEDVEEQPKKKRLPTWVIVLIVLFVIGPVGLVGLSVVATIAIPSLMSARFAVDYQRAQEEVLFLHGAVETSAEVTGSYPLELDELITPNDQGETFLNTSEYPLDPWGNPYVYVPPTEEDPPTVVSFGMDGMPGGDGPAMDVDSLAMILGLQPGPEQDF